jgi:CubicO group peptidase (beta-lactamase class C family)
MPQPQFFAESPKEVGLDPAKVQALLDRAEREVKEGLLPSTQIAIARSGKIAAMRTVGSALQGGSNKPATNDTFYVIFSCTKAIISSAIWMLIGENKLKVSEKVADIIPEFGTNGKDVITVEQVLLHIGGFPNAPYPQGDWSDHNKRLERFKTWRLEWPVASQFMYHATSGFWVLAEILERRSGKEFRQFVAERIATPLGIPDLRVGCPLDLQSRVADVIHVSQALTNDERKKMGLPPLPETEVTEDAINGFNNPKVREAGVPGGGGVTTAADLALFYQGLLHNRGTDGKQIWNPAALADAIRPRSGDYKDPMFGVTVNRGLGVVVAGGDGKSNYRGFGKTNTANAFGHGGAGGQIGWADPGTGISLGYCTNGFDRNDVRQGRRGVALSSLAADCLAK